MLMWIGSYKSVPELSALPEWRREAVWARCRRLLPRWVEAAGVGIALAGGIVGLKLGQWIAPADLWLLGAIAGLFAGLAVGGLSAEQGARRITRFYVRAELGEHCSHCGYSLAGGASDGLCPECGSLIVLSSPRCEGETARPRADEGREPLDCK